MITRSKLNSKLGTLAMLFLGLFGALYFFDLVVPAGIAWLLSMVVGVIYLSISFPVVGVSLLAIFLFLANKSPYKPDIENMQEINLGINIFVAVCLTVWIIAELILYKYRPNTEETATNIKRKK